MTIFRFPLAAARALGPLLSEVDPQRRMHVAARLIFRDPDGYSDAERLGLSPEDHARRVHAGQGQR